METQQNKTEVINQQGWCISTTAQPVQPALTKPEKSSSATNPRPNSKSEVRECFKMVFVGKPGTGKTTVLRRLVRRALEQHRRVLIVTPHDNEWTDIPDVHPAHPERIATYKGARRYLCREPEDVHQVCQMFRHGFLVFDDCRVYVPDRQDPEIRTMLLSCRQNDVDFAAVGHGFTTVPPLFFTYATHFAVFATTDNVGRRKNCVLNFPALEATVRRVNNAALQKPHYYEIVKNE